MRRFTSTAALAAWRDSACLTNRSVIDDPHEVPGTIPRKGEVAQEPNGIENREGEGKVEKDNKGKRAKGTKSTAALSGRVSATKNWEEHLAKENEMQQRLVELQQRLAEQRAATVEAEKIYALAAERTAPMEVHVRTLSV